MPGEFDLSPGDFLFPGHILTVVARGHWVDDDNEGRYIKEEFVRVQALKRLDDEFGKLDINELLKYKGVVVDGCSNQVGIARAT